MMESSPTTMAPLLFRQLFTSVFVSAETLLSFAEKSKFPQFLRNLLVYFFLFVLRLLPSLFPSLNPSVPVDFSLKPPKERDHHSISTKAGDSSIARALSQLLSIMYELPVSSRKYDVVRTLAEKVVEENLRQDFEALREINRTVLSAAFSRSMGQLEAAVTEQERERVVRVGGFGPFDYWLIRVLGLIRSFGWVVKSRVGEMRMEVNGSAEKIAAELLWLAQKLAASGGAEEAVCKWGSASKLAWLAVSAEPRLQGSLVKVSAYLFKQAKEIGHGGEEEECEESKSEEQGQKRMKILMSWLPLLCWASNGTDAPVLNRNERVELERVVEEIIDMLKQEEQEKVLALWLHHFTSSPSSDWPNLQACYERWCNASCKLLLPQCNEPMV